MKLAFFALALALLAGVVSAGRYQTSDVNCAGEYVKCMETESLIQPVTASRRCKDRIRGMDFCAPRPSNGEVGEAPPGYQ